MKKAVLLIAALFIMQAGFAYVEEFTTSDIKTLQGKGYSQDILKIVDTSRMLSQEGDKDYVPFYSRKIYSDKPLIKWYQVAKRYFDPAQDENVFGVRELNYNNSYFEFSPSYSSRLSPNDKYMRLIESDKRRLETSGKTVPGSGGREQEQEEYL
ncbi:MAG: hypothetical protein LUE64_00355 [Candidatus Gastranaerophilales bacterium]|nr:hypothetical protein [Candidatus Gastranaerophilales bacterium]